MTIDSLELLTERNEQEHHTDDYECESYHIVRRAACLYLKVTFSRPLSGDKVSLDLHRGFRTSYRRGTRFTAQLGLSPTQSHQLELQEVESKGSVVTLSLKFPADFPVGKYRLVVEVTPEHSRRGFDKDAEKELVVLFNPWAQEDTVALKTEAEREEYILNESGTIWAGAYNDMFTWPWNFAQFDKVSIEVALYLLDMHSNTDSDSRRDPVKVTRAITEMANVEDDDGGILFGLWSPDEEDYADGTDPTAWSGSSAILQEFWETKKAVRYGQCWVFGGLLTTVLRTLGIPARPITNFESAHDGDGNRALDRYWNLKDELDEDKSHDSIWNYHVWVEAWMSRPDLGPEYNGWQAVDATPQEISPHSKSYVVGPAPLSAVKTGKSLNYDTDFVIAEVNADIRDYCEVEKDKFVLAVTDKKRVGKTISTKAVGSNKRTDITDNYKFEEGSELERAALGIDEPDGPSDVTLDVSFDHQPTIGEDFKLIIKAKSETKEHRSIKVKLNVATASYVGSRTTVLKEQGEISLNDGKESDSWTVRVKSTSYLPHLREQALLSVTLLGVVEETKQTWVTMTPCRLHTPDLTIKVDSKTVKEDESVKLKAGKTYPVRVYFTNPLEKTLTNVIFFVEGARLTKPLKIPVKNAGKRRVAEVSFSINPSPPRRGSSSSTQESKLIVTCHSKELKGIMGTASITVTTA